MLRLAGTCLFLRPRLAFLRERLAREALPPQLVGAVAHALNVGVILRHCLRRVGFLLLARLEKTLGAVLVFMLGHAYITCGAVESSVSNAQRTC
jgi:hypothetical protein